MSWFSTLAICVLILWYLSASSSRGSIFLALDEDPPPPFFFFFYLEEGEVVKFFADLEPFCKVTFCPVNSKYGCVNGSMVSSQE